MIDSVVGKTEDSDQGACFGVPLPDLRSLVRIETLSVIAEFNAGYCVGSFLKDVDCISRFKIPDTDRLIPARGNQERLTGAEASRNDVRLVIPQSNRL